jgi:hypothetical protein
MLDLTQRLLGADLPDGESSVASWPLRGNLVVTGAGFHLAQARSRRAEAA